MFSGTSKAVCLVVLILSSLALSTPVSAGGRKDAPLRKIAPMPPANEARPIDISAEGEDLGNEPTEVNWWKAWQEGDVEKAARIRAILDEEAKKVWSYPKSADDPVCWSPKVSPPVRDEGFSRSFIWGGDVLVAPGTASGGISVDYDAGGNLYAARCSTYEGITNRQVRIYRSTDGGDTWSYFSSYHAQGSYSFSYPVVLTGSQGDKLYVFSLLSQSNGSIGVGRYTLAGAWEGWYWIKSDADTVSYLSACSNYGRGDTLMVAYQREYNGPRFYTLRSTDRGETWGSQSYVDYQAEHPDIAYGRNGYVYAAWENTNDSDGEIWFFRNTYYTVSGFWNELEYLTGDGYSQTYPKIAALHTLPASAAHVWVAYNHNWSSPKLTDTLEYHGTPTYFFTCPSSYGDDLFNVRFSPAWNYSLKSAQLMFYESGSVGSNGVRVYLWNSDGQFPTTKIDSVDIPYGSLQWFPNWTTVDFSSRGALNPVSDFHVGYTSLGSDTVAIISDEGGEPAGAECRSSEYYMGGWGTMCVDWGGEYDFFIRAIVEPAGTGIDLRYAYSTNAGADWSKEHDLATSDDYYEVACDLWAKRDGGYLNMNVCYLKYRFTVPGLERFSYIYQGWTSTSDPTQWHFPSQISEYRAATSYDGRTVCAGVYTGYDRGVLYAGAPLSMFGNYLNLYFDNSSWVDVEEEVGFDEGPEGFSLSPNYPNPFNPTTSIRYTIGGRQSPLRTTLRVYNLRGQLVRTLVDEVKRAGDYEAVWDGKNENGKEVASGIYFYELKVEDYRQTEKMVLIR